MGEVRPDVGVDVGGTKILAAVVDGSGAAVRSASGATPSPAEGADALERALASVVERATGGLRPGRVGVAAAAFVDAGRRRAAYAPHLAWRGEPVAERLAERLGAPVLLENDATCAAWAESALGAARGASSSVTVTVGTGIGGGIVLDGVLVRGANGMAGEFGHTVVDPDGQACACGNRGCWETVASGAALLRAAVTAGGRHRSGHEVTAAARAGDPSALAAFDEVGRWLGRGLADLVAVLDPEVVAVGGGVSSAGDLLLAPARAELANVLVGAGHRTLPAVVRAELGEQAGLLGAVDLLRSAGVRR